ncbi:unnamed protein product [Adineta ricciae]|uniref:Leucine-rich repeat-containing protein 27 n=1 Tax=Adineta ricciae TaxID=249248 RepID=A0A816BZ03_ADIRI|nr:unnamed protein product [Adineta ricciae]
MTNDIETQADLFEFDDEDVLSATSSADLNDEVPHEDLPPELYNQINECLQIEENKQDDELTEFITKAREQDCNCLDLSKRNIAQFPVVLLEYPSLDYLYLEGNQLTELPDDLFLCLPNLKWIDLRNNQLTHIPSNGLAKHPSLRYLLIGGNFIRELPIELGKVKHLSTLNLDGNPLEYPPADIVKQGIKAIQQYLRDEYVRQETLDSEDENDHEEQQQVDIVPDVWASDDDDGKDNQRRKARFLSALGFEKFIDLTKTKIIPKQNNQVTKTVSADPVGDVYAARALEEQRLRRLKHRNIKINEELEKVKSKEYLDEWKEDYRSSQQQLRRKRLVKGRDYPEAVVQAPFGIDPNYIQVMNKDQQEMVERAVKYESRRHRSPESAMQEEENRRTRDRQLQARIREITGKIRERRNRAPGNASEDKHQAELDLHELRKLQNEVRQRRIQINTRFKAYTGDVKARKKL